MTMQPFDAETPGVATAGVFDDPSRAILEQTRALAAAGQLDAAIATLRDFVVDFPQFPGLIGELQQLRERAATLREPVRPAVAAAAQPSPPARPAREISAAPAPATSPGAGQGTPGVAPTVHWRPLLAGATLVGLVAGGVFKLIGPGARPAIERPAPSAIGPSRAEPSAHDPLDQGADSKPIPSTDLPAGPDSSGPVATALVPPTARDVAQRSAKYRPALSSSNSEPALATRRAGESMVSWRLRSRDLDARYRNARTAIEQGHFADALIWLNAIVEEDAHYLNVAELLERVYRDRRTQAEAALRDALELERSGSLAAAALAYDRAIAIDATLTESADRLASLQRVIHERVGRALRRAAVHEAFGLTGDAAVAYAEVTTLLPDTASDRIVAEQRLAAFSGAPRPPILTASVAPFTMPLVPMHAQESLRFVQDRGGRFSALLPRRRWQLTPGAGSTIAIVTEKEGRGSIVVNAVDLNQSVSLKADYDLVVAIESQLVAKREPKAGSALHRTVHPGLPMVILDYRRPGPGGQIRHVRQFSLVRGRTLYRISAMNGFAPFHEVEGVFNDFARSFQPIDRPTERRR